MTQPHHSLEVLADPQQLEQAQRGVPYVLYRLHRGEEAQFSLLRRTFEQHPDAWMHRTPNMRHALLHWSASHPSPSVAPLMRPDCRLLHSP